MRHEEISAMVLQESKELVYIADVENYELLYVNRAILSVLGLPDNDEWLKKPCYYILQGRSEPCPFCTNDKLSKDDFFVWDHFNEMLQRYFILKDKLVMLDDKVARLEIAFDTTEKELAAQKLQKKLHTEEVLVQCIQTLHQNTDTKEAIEKLLEIIAVYYGAERAYIFEADFERDILNNTYEWCSENIVPQIDNLQNIPLDSIDNWFEAFETVGEFYINSLDDEVDCNSLQYEILAAQEISSMMAAPLCAENKIVGFVGVDNPVNHTENLVLIRSVTSFIINDFNRRKLMEQLTVLSYTDGLTKIANRHKYTEVLCELEQNPPESLGIIFADINGLKNANDTYGHDFGDRLIIHTAQVLGYIFFDNTYRIGGDEFVVLFINKKLEQFHICVEKLRKTIAEDDELRISIGVSWEEKEIDISKQIARADELMYLDKQAHYKEKAGEEIFTL